MRALLLALTALTALLAACPAAAPPPAYPTRRVPVELTPRRADAPAITFVRAPTAASIPHAPPAPGTYRVHLIDVGTGLAILVQGADFAMLFDAGTNDRDERPARITAYLEAALGPSGDDACGRSGGGERVAIGNAFLSHPHFDHASALPLVFHCFAVAQFWDAGRVMDQVFYREALAAAAESGAMYRTAGDVPPDHSVEVKGARIEFPRWERFSEGDTVGLGAGARFTILYAEPKGTRDANENSLVVRVELGRARLLLMGDAPSGKRLDPSYPPGGTEAFLLEHDAKLLRADILQVGHHGSKTSSRREFLDAVKPALALVSSGPKRYGTVTLPDAEVIEALRAVGATVLRTDEHDGACPEHDRVGGDRGPGGCDSYVISIGP